MDYIDFIRELDGGCLRGAYLCLIGEPYLWDQLISSLKEAAERGGYLDFNFERLSFSSLDKNRLASALETLPLMANQRIVVIDDLPLDKKRVKANDSLLTLLADQLERPNPTTLLFLGFLGEKPYQASKVYKRMRKQLTLIQLGRLKRGELFSFIMKQFAQQGVEASRQAVQLLMDLSGYLDYQSDKTLYPVQNMVKQAAAMAEGGRLTEKRAREALIDPVEEDVFLFLDALGNRDTALALSYLYGFEEIKRDPMSTFYLVVRQVRKLIGIKILDSRGCPPPQAQRQLQLSAYEYKKLRQESRRVSLEELLAFHNECFQMEKAMKTHPFDMNAALERLVVKMGEGRGN